MSGSHVKIKTDMKILLEIKVKGGQEGLTKTISLSSYVEEVMNDGCLLIHMPTHQGYYYALPADTPILLYFFINHRMFSTSVKFQENIKRDNLLYVKVIPMGSVQPNQRRSCYRLQCSLPIMVERTNTNKNEQQLHKGQMIDFSDGGMLFAANENIAIGEKIKLTFTLDQAETVEASVLRAEPIEDGAYKHKIVAQFICRDKKKKDRFYKYIMNQQREKIQQKSHKKKD